MRKISMLFMIAVTSVVVMACNFVGVIQPNIGGLPSQTAIADESTIQAEEAPLPAVDPNAAAKSCLAKTWKIEGLSDYVIAAVPPELAAEYNLQYQDTTGQAYFTLSPDGRIRLQAEDLAFLFTAKVSIFEVPVTVRIDGTAVGNYEADGTTLTTSDMDTSKLSASAQALNEDLIEPSQIINSIPFVNPPFNAAEYTCQGDILELEVSGFPGNIPPLVFQAAE